MYVSNGSPHGVGTTNHMFLVFIQVFGMYQHRVHHISGIHFACTCTTGGAKIGWE